MNSKYSMRFGRLILASLTAFAAYSYAQVAPGPANTSQSLRLFQAVVPMLVHAADSAASAPVVKSAPHAVLALVGEVFGLIPFEPDARHLKIVITSL